MRAAIEVDLSDDAKKSAADVKKSIAADGDKYRDEHPTPVATISEYSSPATDGNTEKKTNASDNSIVSWVLAILALLVLGFSISVSRKKSKK